MVDEKYNYESLPIPSYEEATSSRPASSQSRSGAAERGDDAERQGLLGQDDSGGISPRRGGEGRNGYQPPTVETARSSLDSSLFLPSSTAGSERNSEELQQEMIQMEVLDPPSDSAHNSIRA